MCFALQTLDARTLEGQSPRVTLGKGDASGSGSVIKLAPRASWKVAVQRAPLRAVRRVSTRVCAPTTTPCATGVSCAMLSLRTCIAACIYFTLSSSFYRESGMLLVGATAPAT